ncbi:MAG: hypothetical protein R2941_17370 [Desulfobacterales bacterium]
MFSLITLCGIVLIFLAFAWYFSPMAEVRDLRTENNALRDALSAAQNGNETELVAMVIMGFMGVLITCFAFFFLLLCFLAGKTPAEFFRPAYPPLPVPKPKPEPKAQPAQIECTQTQNCNCISYIPDYPADYYMGR